MKKTIITSTFLIFALFFTPIFTGKTSAQVGGVLVYPNIIELDFSKNNRKFISRIVKVENPSPKDIRIRAYIESWDVNEGGAPQFTKEVLERSIADYIKFNPKEFDLKPGQNQVVRVTAKLPEGSEGEYRGMIFFETVPTREEIVQPDKKNVNVAITFITRFGVVVYAYKGNINKDANLDDFKVAVVEEKDFISATLHNTGNVHSVIKGEVTLYADDNPNEPVNIIGIKKPILPEKPLHILIPLKNAKLKDGHYTAKLKLNYLDTNEKTQVIEAETSFDYTNKEETTKTDLEKPVLIEDVKMTPENIAKPIEIDTTEIKLTPEAN